MSTHGQKYYSNKIVLIGLLLLSGCSLLGQQKLCPASKHQYGVDLTENSGNGTLGSTYVWKVLESNFSGSYLPITTSGNQVEIDWQNTPSGTYTLQVTETNSCGSVIQELKVTITKLFKLI